MSSPNADRRAPGEAPQQTSGKRPRRSASTPELLIIERLYRFVGLKPQWTGVLIVAISLTVLTVLEIATGRMDDILGVAQAGRVSFLESTGFDPYGYFFLVFHILLIGYVPTAVVLLVRSARRHAEALRELVEPTERARALLTNVGTHTRPQVLAAGIGGALAATIVPVLDVEVWRDQLFNPYDVSGMTPEVFTQRILAWVFGFFVGVLLYCASKEAWRFNRLAREIRVSMLLEPHTLMPFTRLGLSNVLIVSIFPAILLLFLFNPSLAPIILVICGISFLFALAGLFGPLLGIHARVAAAKQQQLGWVNGELAKEREGLKSGEGERFVSLMAYRSYIESVREWPLDSSTLGRLALYLAIPLFSWVGAAVVERIVDAALG